MQFLTWQRATDVIVYMLSDVDRANNSVDRPYSNTRFL